MRPPPSHVRTIGTMLRAILGGLIAISVVLSGVASCKSKEDAPAVAVRTAAGKVVEVSGKVDATRDGKPRPLAPGAEIFADDVIATGADGAVVIELFHNSARWSVESGRSTRVDASLAWGLSKQQAAAATEHATASAGRNAERAAADTGATVPAAEAAAATEQPSAMPMPTTATEQPAPAKVEGKKSDRAPADTPEPKRRVPPPPPPGGGKLGTSGGGGGGGGADKTEGFAVDRDRDEESADKQQSKNESAKVGTKGVAKPLLDPAIRVRGLVETQRAALVTCLGTQAEATLTVIVTNGRATFVIADASEPVRACIGKVIAKITFPAIDGKASIALRK